MCVCLCHGGNSAVFSHSNRPITLCIQLNVFNLYFSVCAWFGRCLICRCCMFAIKFFAYRNDYNRADFGWLDIFDNFHWQICPHALSHTHTHALYIFAKITYCSFLQSLASPFQSAGFSSSIPHAAAALYFIQHHKFQLELVNTILLCRRSCQLNCKSCLSTIKRVSKRARERESESAALPTQCYVYLL